MHYVTEIEFSLGFADCVSSRGSETRSALRRLDRTRHRIKMKICGGVAHHKWIRGAIAVSPPVFYYALVNTDDACENDVCLSRSLPGFNLGRRVCLFRSKFLFSCCLLIPVSFSISCQDMCKKKLYNIGQVLPDEFV